MTTKPLRVGWHREHFLSPLLQFAAEDKGQTFELVECPGGTGEMRKKMESGEIDICIALTDALIAGIANGDKSYKLIGRYISTPLRWAIITGSSSSHTSSTLSTLKRTPIGISRLGSGSQVMASVMTLNEGWAEDEKPSFVVKGSFGPLRDSVNSGETSVFLWEWFTTKPYADSGEVRFIGSVDTPWPCWMIASTPSTPSNLSASFLTTLSRHATQFNSSPNRQDDGPGGAVAYVSENFGLKKEDVKEWLDGVGWYEEEGVVEKKVVLETLKVLAKAGVVTAPKDGWNVSDFVNEEVARIV